MEPFRKVGDSAKNDYKKGMPAAHTLFQEKSLALIANARKVGESLHFLQQPVPESHPCLRRHHPGQNHRGAYHDRMALGEDGGETR